MKAILSDRVRPAEKGNRSLDLKDFYAAAAARADLWSELSAAGRDWLAAEMQGREVVTFLTKASGTLARVAPLEEYNAYPGPHLMAGLKEALQQENAGLFSQLALKISTALLTGNYRLDPAAWDPIHESVGTVSATIVPPDVQAGQAQKPYFELLIVTTGDPDTWESARQELRRLRRGEDHFHYEIVQVGTFEDALIAVIVNTNLQAVVIHDGISLSSKYELPVMRDFLKRHLQVDASTIIPDSVSTTLARVIKNQRPQLDLYLLTDHAVEKLAGTPAAESFRRIFYGFDEVMEIHLAVLDGVNDRFKTPFFSNLKRYAQRPVGTFHALPVARGKSVFRSNWIRDMGAFYGTNIFLAESSATSGGLDSLLEPTGTIKEAQDMAARAFGAKRAYFATNGTSTSNKIVVQAICKPGDIVVVDRNCHKSHHYGFVLTGAQPYYVEAFPLTQYSMYGAVPLRSIKKALLDCRAEGKLDKVKAIDLTNCTFDGHMYNTKRVMEECLAIKPDLVFIWDEAWFGFARFDPFHRRRTAMGAAAALTARFRDPAYRQEYASYLAQTARLDPKSPKWLDIPLMPDPDQVRIRVYQTHSTHKSMSAFRQGSMILVWDEDFDKVHGSFEEAFFTHTSTSPNQQLIASLDVARRQMELEGYELNMRALDLSMRIRREVNTHPLISKYFHVATAEEMVPAEFRASGLKEYGQPHSTWKEVLEAWETDEIALDPTRLTLICGTAALDGTQFKKLLADKYDVQVNKTSRNSILLQSNINNSRSDVALLIKVLADISRDIEKRLAEGGSSEKSAFEAQVKSLMTDVPDLPNFSHFHPAFRDNPKAASNEGHMRPAFFMAYDEKQCEYVKLSSKDVDDRLKNGPELVSANFVIPYPPGFPIMVPGQVITRETITFMRQLDVKEIHGYHAAQGIKLIKPSALEKRPSTAA